MNQRSSCGLQTTSINSPSIKDGNHFVSLSIEPKLLGFENAPNPKVFRKIHHDCDSRPFVLSCLSTKICCHRSPSCIVLSDWRSNSSMERVTHNHLQIRRAVLESERLQTVVIVEIPPSNRSLACLAPSTSASPVKQRTRIPSWWVTSTYPVSRQNPATVSHL